MEDGDPALVEAIKNKRWREVSSLSPRQRALGELAEKLTLQPTRMTATDWRPLRELGFGDEALLEVAHVVALFNYVTKLADGFGLVLDAETESAASSGVPLRRTE